MMKHGKILVPTDFSEHAGEALRRAGLLAKESNVEVHLLHVMEPVLYFESDQMPVYPLAEINDSIRKHASRQLQELAEAAGFSVHVHLEEFGGDPSRAICMFAESLPADLILIGRHGHQGAIERFLIGSTAERVVRHANCSVLVCMPHGLFGNAAADAKGSRQGLKIRK